MVPSQAVTCNILLSLIWFFLPLFDACQFPTKSYESLKDVYSATKGSQWKWRSSNHRWNFSVALSPSANPCVDMWEGIDCTFGNVQIDTCDVFNLTLVSYGLNGTLPSSIVNLTSLSVLDLTDNNLSGTIPPSILAISNLSILHLDDNHFEGSLPKGTTSDCRRLIQYTTRNNALIGSIPSTLTSWTSLVTIDFSGNKLSGSLPSSIGALSNLEYLNISINRIAGSIPYQFQSLRKLQTMDASENKLAGTLPRYLNELTSLTTFVLQYNKIGGSIPSEVTQLQQLQTLKLDKNKFIGSIPAGIGNMSALDTLYLFNNALTGTIPSSLCSLPRIKTLLLNNNILRGTIPVCLGNLSNSLRDISLRYNLLTGQIPSSVSQLSNLIDLDLSSNQLSGSIPLEIGHVFNLQSLRLYDNVLSGTIPSSMTNMSVLRECLLYTNGFHGSLPGDIASWMYLTDFIVSQNSLEGSIPSNLSRWQSIEQFEIYLNQLTGMLPSSTPWAMLTSLQINGNYFTGTLPAAIGQFHQVQYVNGFENFFSGSFPPSIAHWTSVIIFDFHGNRLTGSLPVSTLVFPSLQYFDIHENHLTGSLPATLSSWTSLIALDVSTNQFRGTIGGCTSLSLLNALNVSHNQLTGSIPTDMQALTRLQLVDLSNNRFGGHLGTLFASLPALQTLVVSQNALTGLIEHVVDTTRQRQLLQLDLSENHLSGTIPNTFFVNSTLVMISLAHNCITGNLPPDICNGTQFETIVLDSLYGACASRIFPHTSIGTYVSNHRLQGSIPRCLLEHMPVLQTLHLSSNGIEGSLPMNASLSSSLQDLTLSHNALSGPIPNGIQAHNWSTLDLSFNRFSGTLLEVDESTISPSMALSLAVNRLSGPLPSYLFTITSSMHVLSGNLFQCAWNNKPLPSADVDADSYECGSNATNLPLFLWAFVPPLLLMIWIGKEVLCGGTTSYHTSLFCSFLVSRGKVLEQGFRTTCSRLRGAGVVLMAHGLRDVVLTIQYLHQSLVGSVLWLLIVVSPIYAWLSSQYGVYGNSFVWAVSMGYLSGVYCAIVLVVVLVVTAILLNTAFHSSRSSVADGVTATEKGWKPSLGLIMTNGIWWRMGLVVVLNTTVVLTVNLFFVYITTQSLSSDTMLVINWIMSLFKLAWMKFGLVRITEYTLSSPQRQHLQTLQPNHPSMSMGTASSTPDTSHHHHASVSWRKIKTIFLTSLSIFNNILAPIVAEAFISPNCFYYVIVPPPVVTPSYSYSSCLYRVFYEDSGTIRCGQYGIVHQTSAFRPSFAYNFQCSSSLLATFAPIFLYKFLTSAVLYPTWIAGVIMWQQRLRQQPQQQQHPMSRPTDSWLLTIPRIWRPYDVDDIQHLLAGPATVMTSESMATADVMHHQINPLQSKKISSMRNAAQLPNDSIDPSPIDAIGTTISPSPPPPPSSKVPVYDFITIEYVVSALIGDLCVVMSFGVVFPVIAIVGTIAIIVDTMILQVGMARLLQRASKSSSGGSLHAIDLAQHCATLLLQQTHEVGSLIEHSYGYVIGISSVVWTCFVFDTLGDVVGVVRAAWVWSLVGIVGLLSYSSPIVAVSVHAFVVSIKNKAVHGFITRANAHPTHHSSPTPLSADHGKSSLPSMSDGVEMIQTPV